MPYSIAGFTKIFIKIGNSTIFFFSWHPMSVNLLWCQECTFYCVPRKKRYSSSYTFSCTIIKKIKNPLCDYIIMARSLLNWKTTQTTEKD